jgi:hypothetical protein
MALSPEDAKALMNGLPMTEKPTIFPPEDQ